MLKAVSNLKAKSPLIFNLSVLLLCSILITLPAYFGGIPGGLDMPQHFQFAQTFYDSVLNGDYYPSWASNTNYGYGDVSVRFYPPLTYYLLIVFHNVAGNWFDASCLMVIFLFFVSGLGVYLWSREWFSENASLAAALTYIVLPYHVNQFYGASLYAEFVAAAILPFCFFYTNRVCQKGRTADILSLAIAFGLLILSHLPTTVMASFSLLIYTLFSLNKTNFFRSIVKLSLAVLTSVLLSSFYWLRMATELGYVKHTEESFTSDSYSYLTHFAFLRYFPFIEVDAAGTSSVVDLMLLFTLGVGVGFGVVYFLRAKEKGRYPITNVLAMTAFALIMTTPLSLKIWEYIPLFQKIQFPWRWIILVSLGISILVGSGFDGILAYVKTPKRYLTILVLGLLLSCLPYNYFRVMILLFNYPKEHFNPMVERIKVSPSNECWWTTWAQKIPPETNKFILPRPKYIADKVVINDRHFEIRDWSSTDRVFTIDPGASGQALIATLYYPHWKAQINGQAVEVTPSEIGLISFPVPDESAEVKLYFEEPKSILAAYYLSAFGWFLIFAFIALSRFRLIRRKND